MYIVIDRLERLLNAMQVHCKVREIMKGCISYDSHLHL